MEISVATMEIIMDIPPQTGNSANMWSCCTTPGHISKECKSAYNRETCTCMFIAALFYYSQTVRISLCVHQLMKA
jgi:hypothetical protein